MATLRLPNITSPTTEGQLQQVKTYLYQLTNQLNYALKSAEDMEKLQGNSLTSSDNSLEGTDAQKAQDTFFQVKNLIIKSADIVNAYYDVITKKLNGEYFAESDFGTFIKKTTAIIEQTPENATEYYSSVQEIKDTLNNLDGIRKDNCYIRTGWLDENNTIAGVEIGMVGTTEAGLTDRAFARFTTNELIFYDESGECKEENILARFAKYKLHIKDAVIEGNLWLGGYKLDTADGIAFLPEEEEEGDTE